MSPIERGCLIYLLDALKVAPNKLHLLIKIANIDNSTFLYRQYLEKLKMSSADDLYHNINQIRNETI